MAGRNNWFGNIFDRDERDRFGDQYRRQGNRQRDRQDDEGLFSSGSDFDLFDEDNQRNQNEEYEDRGRWRSGEDSVMGGPNRGRSVLDSYGYGDVDERDVGGRMNRGEPFDNRNRMSSEDDENRWRSGEYRGPNETEEEHEEFRDDQEFGRFRQSGAGLWDENDQRMRDRNQGDVQRQRGMFGGSQGRDDRFERRDNRRGR
jgi:hypothetical protein